MGAERILVVDDEERIVKTISHSLEREGLSCTCAFDGQQAVGIYTKSQFDLVLLDVSMPGMDGYEVMARILAQNRDAIVVIMTGYATVESAVKALKHGAWDYLKKPFDYTDLVKTVKNGLTQHRLLSDKNAVAARLKASENQFERMVNHSPDLIFTLDEDGRFTFVNDQFEKVLGFPKKALLGNRFEALVYSQDRPRVNALIRATQNGKNNPNPFADRRVNLRLKKAKQMAIHGDPTENLAFMELKVSPIQLTAGSSQKEREGIYAVARDVTHRVHLEAQLRQAQKMEALGTLAGGIAHDFNNILMGIQGYASLVKTGFEHDSLEYNRLACIDEYVASGAEMARQLLDFAQKNQQETGLINLNYLLKMSAKMFGRTKKDILIDLELEKQLWATPVDEGQIKQVLINLFVNAWQAMPRGGKIIIRTENVTVEKGGEGELGLTRHGTFVKVTVSDTGMGMDKKTMVRIFDPFFTTKDRGQGTGLGLATAYGIIKQHQGSFKVESRKGKGSSFMFYLPAKAAAARSKQPAKQKEKIINGKGTILLVDDEKGVIEVCSEMIRSLGYAVKIANSGFEAVKIMNKAPEAIDLVILDMVMPGLNGDETFELLRRIRSDAKVLISSGFAKEAEVQDLIGKGCTDFIRKPFDVAVLSEKIDSVFKTTV